jgi:hypothetical protein
VQIIFGWPAILLSLAVSVIGVVKKWPWMVMLGGVVIIPFSIYLSGYPSVRFGAFLLPLFQFGSAWAVHQKRKPLAWSMLIPLALVSILLAFVVLTQN